MCRLCLWVALETLAPDPDNGFQFSLTLGAQNQQLVFFSRFFFSGNVRIHNPSALSYRNSWVLYSYSAYPPRLPKSSGEVVGGLAWILGLFAPIFDSLILMGLDRVEDGGHGRGNGEHTIWT